MHRILWTRTPEVNQPEVPGPQYRKSLAVAARAVAPAKQIDWNSECLPANGMTPPLSRNRTRCPLMFAALASFQPLPGHLRASTAERRGGTRRPTMLPLVAARLS